MVPLPVVNAHGGVEVLIISLCRNKSCQGETVRLVDHDFRERVVQEGVGVDAVASWHLSVGLEEPLHREAAFGKMHRFVWNAQRMASVLS